jgi:hypothetical protein
VQFAHRHYVLLHVIFICNVIISENTACWKIIVEFYRRFSDCSQISGFSGHFLIFQEIEARTLQKFQDFQEIQDKWEACIVSKLLPSMNIPYELVTTKP